MEEELINSIAKKFNLDIQQINEGHQIKIYNKSKFYCKIDIGTDALEWYITLVEKSSNDIIYEDWMDYLGYDERKEIDLIKDKLNDLIFFIGNWILATDIKVEIDRFFFKLIKNKTCFWKINGRWMELTMCKVDNGDK